MARLARLTVPGIPHHITRRGNHRQPVFFRDADHSHYLALLKEQGGRFGVQVWAYCLMENHVHLIAVPETEQSLSRGIGEAHAATPEWSTNGKGGPGTSGRNSSRKRIALCHAAESSSLHKNREELLHRANDLFNWIASGNLKLRIDKSFPLTEAAEAHRQLEGRKTTGEVLLIP